MPPGTGVAGWPMPLIRFTSPGGTDRTRASSSRSSRTTSSALWHSRTRSAHSPRNLFNGSAVGHFLGFRVDILASLPPASLCGPPVRREVTFHPVHEAGFSGPRGGVSGTTILRPTTHEEQLHKVYDLDALAAVSLWRILWGGIFHNDRHS